MRRQDKNTSGADIITIMADHIHVCSRDGPNSLAIVWVTEDNNWDEVC